MHLALASEAVLCSSVLIRLRQIGIWHIMSKTHSTLLSPVADVIKNMVLVVQVSQ